MEVGEKEFWLVGCCFHGRIITQLTVSPVLVFCLSTFFPWFSSSAAKRPFWFTCSHQESVFRRSILLLSQWSWEQNRSKQYSIVEQMILFNPRWQILRDPQRKSRKEQLFHFWVTDSEVEIEQISNTCVGL